MATTGQKVFDMAIYLMDEQNEATGSTVTGDTQEYRLRSVDILNVLKHECYPASDTYEVPESGGHGICQYINSLEDELDLDDAVAQGALPYGLASRLLLGENDVLANFFEQKFREMLAQLQARRGAVWDEIALPYGAL